MQQKYSSVSAFLLTILPFPLSNGPVPLFRFNLMACDIQELRLDDLMVSSGSKLYETVKFPGVCRGMGFLRAGMRVWEQLEGALGMSCSRPCTLPSLSRCAPSPAWQCVERDLRNQMSGSERGLVEEYVEKIPNPSLKAFKPVDLSDLKRRNTQDAKKS
uniref:MAPK regulated corepressor interacting protein 1 n=2 Tax=Chelydra serpentina TaxID=8475 RepID=A0A8C3XPP3_CHESE